MKSGIGRSSLRAEWGYGLRPVDEDASGCGRALDEPSHLGDGACVEADQILRRELTARVGRRALLGLAPLTGTGGHGRAERDVARGIRNTGVHQDVGRVLRPVYVARGIRAVGARRRG